jgi:hypothetical protein
VQGYLWILVRNLALILVHACRQALEPWSLLLIHEIKIIETKSNIFSSGLFLLLLFCKRQTSMDLIMLYMHLKKLVRKIRAKHPSKEILFRADGGFYKPQIVEWCEANKVSYIVDFSAHSKIKSMTSDHREAVREEYESTKKKQREFHEINYRAQKWSDQISPRVIGKFEYNNLGENTRFILTNLKQ